MIDRLNIWTFDIERTTSTAPLLDANGSVLFDSLASVLFDSSGDLQDPELTFDVSREEVKYEVTRVTEAATIKDSAGSVLCDSLGEIIYSAPPYSGDWTFDINRLNNWTFNISR